MINDLDILLSDEFSRSVEENLDRDPMRIALDGRVAHAALVASQVKYLRRAWSKLPSYHAARCVLPPLAFEQSSSERTAARKNYSGRLAVDLTCGLGVDSYYLARHFERVIAVERDPQLAAVTRENFRRLGVQGIEVVNAAAEEFLADCQERADLVYADPDRRSGEGKKMVRIEECSPDIVALLPDIRRLAPRLVVKLSPLFDVDEVFRLFGLHTRAEVVSLDGECKEIIAEVNFPEQTILPSVPSIRAVAIGIGEAEYGVLLPSVLTGGCETPAPHRALAQRFDPGNYRWLVVPDVALQKARLARRDLSQRGIYIDSDNGYGFAAEKPEGIMGKIYEIESIEPFDPKSLKRRLKAEGIRSLDILRRDFPLSTAGLAHRLGIREGGETKIAFTRAAGKLWQIFNLNSR